MKKKVPVSVGECFNLIERSMFKGPWVMGETYSVGDPYLFTLAQWLEADGLDPSRFPKVYVHRSRMAARSSVKKVLAEELEGMR
jgi:glutathione S-transferase